MDPEVQSLLLSGNEAVALAACHAGVALATAYPGTPSTEILECMARLGGPAQWSPNEKVAYEVALGAAFGGARALAAMKHVGVNVAADAVFTSTYTGISGGLVLVSADDPGMASSQNEQDNRRYAVAAGLPMLEPSDSQETYDFLFDAYAISERWRLPVMLRLTTRICHSKTVVRPRSCSKRMAPLQTHFESDIRGRVMIPGNARPAHRRLRAKLAEIDAWNETNPLNRVLDGAAALGIVTSGVAFMHAREADPTARILKLGMTYPLPMALIRSFADSVTRCFVIEENDPYLVEALSAAGIPVEGKPEMFRFGELNVERVRNILNGDHTPEVPPPPGRPPELCAGCPHRATLSILKGLDCIIVGDIGCYALAALPPIEALETCVCMGSAITLGLGLRHVLPPDEARCVVSVLGDSTFVHSGITGLVEMVYNPPSTGHVVVILDNGTTAMTGMQDHPGTGRRLNGEPTHRLAYDELARAVGVERVYTLDPVKAPDEFERVMRECLDSEVLSLVVARRPCALAAKRVRANEREGGADCERQG